MKLAPTLLCTFLFFSFPPNALTQTAKYDHEIAARFAPVFYQGIGDNQRSDYITNFDFDGDWRGDNNWDHVANKRYPLKAYVYYSVVETRTHYFIHYAIFHARDYKGGATKGKILSELLRDTVKVGSESDPTGMAIVATVAHENDMEGCLVVVEKAGNDLARANVVFVTTVAHNKFLKYTAGSEKPDAMISIVDHHPLLYVEPKGHGVRNYLSGDMSNGNDSGESTTAPDKQANSKTKSQKAKEKEAKEAKNGIVIYHFAGRAEQPDKAKGDSCAYDLVPIETTLWKHAQTEANETFGVVFDYPPMTIDVVSTTERQVAYKAQIGMRGMAFLGNQGGKNIARAPWGWFDVGDQSQPLGTWFFDPAKAIKRQYRLAESFSTAYVRHPILGIGN